MKKRTSVKMLLAQVVDNMMWSTDLSTNAPDGEYIAQYVRDGKIYKAPIPVQVENHVINEEQALQASGYLAHASGYYDGLFVEEFTFDNNIFHLNLGS